MILLWAGRCFSSQRALYIPPGAMANTSGSRRCCRSNPAPSHHGLPLRYRCVRRPWGSGREEGSVGGGAQPCSCSLQRLGAPKLGRPGGLARAPHGSILSRTGQVRPVPALLYGDFAVLPHGPHRRPRPNKNHLGTAVLVEGTLERLCKCHAALCSEPFLSDAFYCPPEKGTHQEGMGTARRTTVGFL